MTFIEAMNTGKPMRRQGTLIRDVFLVLVTDDDRPRFVTTHGAAPVGISRADYLADDWQVSS